MASIDHRHGISIAVEVGRQVRVHTVNLLALFEQ